MQRIVLFIALFAGINLASAGMMGGMGGGMMGSQSSPATPPAKDADPSIRKGYDLSQQYCTQCHQAPNPNQHAAADWPPVMTRMQTYMQQQHRLQPNASDRQLILDYLSQSGTAQE